MLADSAGAGRYGAGAGAGPVTIPGRLPVLVRVGPGAGGAWLSGARRLSCSWGAASLRRFGMGGVRGRGVKDMRRSAGSSASATRRVGWAGRTVRRSRAPHPRSRPRRITASGTARSHETTHLRRSRGRNGERKRVGRYANAYRPTRFRGPPKFSDAAHQGFILGGRAGELRRLIWGCHHR